MKLLEIDWQAFLQMLEQYRRLPFGARRAFVEKIPTSQPVNAALVEEWLQPLIESGLAVVTEQSRSVRVDPRFQGFSRALRAFHRSRIFAAPSRETFQAFVSENFEGPEISSFSGTGHEYYYYRDYAAVQAVYARVCSAEWLKAFLTAEGPSWETKYLAAGKSPYFSSPPVLKDAQAIVHLLVPGAAPVPMAQLMGMRPNAAPDTLGAAIMGGLRYLLLYPCLLGEGLEPALGLWPSAARKLSADIPRPPEPVHVSQPFHSAFLVDDMTSVLSTCAVAPPRIRAGDFQIFEADKRGLLASMGTLPEWVEEEFRISLEARLTMAISFLRHNHLLGSESSRGREVRLGVTDEGSRWLTLTGKDRFKSVLDALRGPVNQAPLYDTPTLVPDTRSIVSVRYVAVIASALQSTFAASPVDVFVRRRDFLNYHKDAGNPFVAIVKKDPYTGIPVAGRDILNPSADELEEGWCETLAEFLRLRLLPLGGVRVGFGAELALSFAITEAGRYLLGAQDDFQFGSESPGRIVLQPNCEVVFLGPSARAESEIARFCERHGRHVGTLFKVTKKSILEAAATGLTASQVLDTLREYCGPELPGNVEREIVGWFNQYRQVSVVRATLIRCPDADTAARVMAVAGNRAARITETILEWREEKVQAALQKKLREMGIFLR